MYQRQVSIYIQRQQKNIDSPIPDKTSGVGKQCTSQENIKQVKKEKKTTSHRQMVIEDMTWMHIFKIKKEPIYNTNPGSQVFQECYEKNKWRNLNIEVSAYYKKLHRKQVKQAKKNIRQANNEHMLKQHKGPRGNNSQQQKFQNENTQKLYSKMTVADLRRCLAYQ